MRTFFIALRALVFATVFVSLWGWLALQVSAFDRRIGLALPEWVTIPGVVAMAIGAILALGCVGVFVIWGRGTPAVFDAPRAFVAVGPYRWVRNPMYLGGWMMLLGFALFERSLSMLLFGLAWIFVVHLFVVYVEEPGLRRRFGEPYDAYCKATRRWVPRR